MSPHDQILSQAWGPTVLLGQRDPNLFVFQNFGSFLNCVYAFPDKP